MGVTDPFFDCGRESGTSMNKWGDKMTRRAITTISHYHDGYVIPMTDTHPEALELVAENPFFGLWWGLPKADSAKRG